MYSTNQNAFEGYGTHFDVIGTNLGNNGVKAALNISTELCDGFTFYGEFSGEHWKNWAAYALDLGITLWW